MFGKNKQPKIERYKDPVEDAFWAVVSPFLIIGVVIGAGGVGIVYGLVKLLQHIF